MQLTNSYVTKHIIDYICCAFNQKNHPNCAIHYNMAELEDLTMAEAIEWLEVALDKSTAENPNPARINKRDWAWEKLRLAVDVDEAFKHATRLGKVPESLVQSKKIIKLWR